MCVSLLMLSCRHNTDINNDMHTGKRYVILAKHWMFPDDGFM